MIAKLTPKRLRQFMLIIFKCKTIIFLNILFHNRLSANRLIPFLNIFFQLWLMRSSINKSFRFYGTSTIEAWFLSRDGKGSGLAEPDPLINPANPNPPQVVYA